MSRRPSPSLVVSIIALVFAAAGTSIAAVNFAKNAGAVDGKSATGAGSSSSRAAGKLVATYAGGPLKGKIPSRFLDLSGVIAGSKQSFGQGIEVVDNSSAAPVTIAGAPGLGTLTATCIDQSNTAGKEDPQASVTFINTAGQPVNYIRSTGAGAPTVSSVAAGAQQAFNINGTNTFHLYAQVGVLHYIVEGVVRQDNANTAAATCAVFGYALAL
jgi:hypothetical protein